MCGRERKDSRACSTARDAWYELRTSGPDSTCVKPISYPARRNSSNSSGVA